MINSPNSNNRGSSTAYNNVDQIDCTKLRRKVVQTEEHNANIRQLCLRRGLYIFNPIEPRGHQMITLHKQRKRKEESSITH